MSRKGTDDLSPLAQRSSEDSQIHLSLDPIGSPKARLMVGESDRRVEKTIPLAIDRPSGKQSVASILLVW